MSRMKNRITIYRGSHRNIMKSFHDSLIIYSKWMGYLEEKHADPKIKEFIESEIIEWKHVRSVRNLLAGCQHLPRIKKAAG